MIIDLLCHSVEFFASERFKQVVDSVDLITLHRILGICRHKHDHRRIVQSADELKPVIIRHIDVYEDQISLTGSQSALCRLDIMARGDEFQKRIFEYIAFQLVESQRLVVNDYASYVHIPGIISVTQ